MAEPHQMTEASLTSQTIENMPSSPRRFPAPWSAELQPNYYVVRDADGQQIAYIYFEEEPGRRSAAKSGLLRRFECAI